MVVLQIKNGVFSIIEITLAKLYQGTFISLPEWHQKDLGEENGELGGKELSLTPIDVNVD